MGRLNPAVYCKQAVLRLNLRPRTTGGSLAIPTAAQTHDYARLCLSMVVQRYYIYAADGSDRHLIAQSRRAHTKIGVSGDTSDDLM